MNAIRFFDVLFALLGSIVLLPVFLVLALCIKIGSKGPILFKQVRVGRHGVDFKLLKFRSMTIDAEAKGQLTVGGRDARITPIGFFLRKYKLDELPQLLNVLIGDMSLVGPRPEVRKYVEYYNPQQMRVLEVRPGITDYASLEYRNENELLAKAEDPEAFYIKEVMPQKIELNQQFINNPSLANYFGILFKTVIAAIKGS
jgi:lipopolysaccharide/colanic/teichoic acid biosynthesis glycosyltransferase